MCWCLDAFYILPYCWKHHQHTTGNYNSQGGMHTRSWIKKVFGHSRKEDNLLPKPCKTKDSLWPQHATNWEIVCTNWEVHLLIGNSWWKSWKSAAVVKEGKKRPTTVNTSENKEDGHLDFSWWMTRKKVRAPEYLRKKKRAPPPTHFFKFFFDWQKRRKMDIPTCISFPQPPCNAQEQMSTEFLACQSLTG